jgi:hypothetical protein
MNKYYIVKEERNIPQTIKRMDTWITHILRRNCLLKLYNRKDRERDGSKRKTRKKT